MSSFDSAFRLSDLPPPTASSLLDGAVPIRSHRFFRHHTWARTFTSYPELYIQPETIEEVQKIVLLARVARRRVVVVGSGHSPSHLTCTSAWMVNLDRLSQVLKVDKSPAYNGGRVLVQAGISLQKLNQEAEKHDLTIPNLGSINVQSIAGAIATATHGSSVRHGLLSQNVRSLRIVLADGSAIWCARDNRPDLYRAALVSLGALGIITEVEFQLAPSTNIEWEQRLVKLNHFLDTWDKGLWSQSEFVRCWWLPHMQRVIVWKADKTQKPLRVPKPSSIMTAIWKNTYEALLLLSNTFPKLLPLLEYFVSGTLSLGSVKSGVEVQRSGLLMDCLFSQFVNEWAIPLEKGPEALLRLSMWLNGDVKGSNIPIEPTHRYVHCPIEVRATQGSSAYTSPRGFMDPSMPDGPTLYLNATLYRPYGFDPPCREKYYAAFEYLMKELGGRPHWAKNFTTVTNADFRTMYGNDMDRYLQVRNDVDPDGMFIGSWHRQHLLGEHAAPLALEEKELDQKPLDTGGVHWSGTQQVMQVQQSTPSPVGMSVRSSRSEESFDSLATSTGSGDDGLMTMSEYDSTALKMQ